MYNVDRMFRNMVGKQPKNTGKSIDRATKKMIGNMNGKTYKKGIDRASNALFGKNH